ncbi:MAG: hypothetical protein PHO07_16375 [Pirellulales bacterium]|nr:hypothetical protein [Pirellulales bacterium]
MEKTNVKRPTTRIAGPITGRLSKAALVRSAPSVAWSVQTPEFTSTRPVMKQTTTVSQKVPLDETRPWRTGLVVRAAAATIGALPRPDSLEKRPLAMP